MIESRSVALWSQGWEICVTRKRYKETSGVDENALDVGSGGGQGVE